MLKIIENPDLPKEIFAVEVSPQLLAQAVRVYLANQRQGNQSALTRAEVNRTRRKIFKQKGTGHARHGDRKSPIFVGGGIAFAPKPRDYSLSLSGKMRALAKVGALSAKKAEKYLFVVDGLDKLTGKTKELASFIDDVASKTVSDKQNSDKGQRKWKWLVVTDKIRDNVVRASRNIDNLEIAPANLVNTYQIIRADRVIVMPEAVNAFTPNEINEMNQTNEAPAGSRPGYLLPSLRRERNPSEAKNSSLSSAILRSRYFAKGDKTIKTIKARKIKATSVKVVKPVKKVTTKKIK